MDADNYAGAPETADHNLETSSLPPALASFADKKYDSALLLQSGTLCKGKGLPRPFHRNLWHWLCSIIVCAEGAHPAVSRIKQFLVLIISSQCGFVFFPSAFFLQAPARILGFCMLKCSCTSSRVRGTEVCQLMWCLLILNQEFFLHMWTLHAKNPGPLGEHLLS